MPDEPFPVRRKIRLKRRYDWREHAPNTFAHGFTSNIKLLTIKHRFLNSSFIVLTFSSANTFNHQVVFSWFPDSPSNFASQVKLARVAEDFAKPKECTAAIIYYGVLIIYGLSYAIGFMRFQAALPSLNIDRAVAQTGVDILESWA
jgi:hypothetical protein